MDDHFADETASAPLLPAVEAPSLRAHTPLKMDTSPSAAAASPPRRVTMQALRALLHLAVVLSLTFHSAHVGNALHPYERALANEWIRLLFYVETTEIIPTYDATDESHEVVPVTLPHFLLESQEEIAANVDDEFFSGGFAARASSYPVGLLFTIMETRKHLHGAIDNYTKLAKVALDRLYVAGDASSGELIPHPELTVWTSWDGESVAQKYRLTGQNESEWPTSLRLNHTNSTETRRFFDLVDGMELRFLVGMKQNNSLPHPESDELLMWWVRFTYDLQSQGHLEVSLNFGLRPVGSHNLQANFGRQQLPGIFFIRDTLFDCCLLSLIAAYQSVEFVLKWWNSQTTIALLSPRGTKSPRYYRTRAWRIFQREARDFWFWGILGLNIMTVACLSIAWSHSYRLHLWDALCMSFASCCALHWISLVRYLSVNARFHILGLTLQRGLPRVAQFLVGVFPIFVGYVLFGTIMFGAKVPRFQTPGATATTLFAIANGDEIHDTFNSVAFTPWIGQIYVYSYLILFSYVVLMVCIGIIEDAFFSAVFPASWPSLHQTEANEASQRSRRETQSDQEEEEGG